MHKICNKLRDLRLEIFTEAKILKKENFIQLLCDYKTRSYWTKLSILETKNRLEILIEYSAAFLNYTAILCKKKLVFFKKIFRNWWLALL